VKLDQKRCVADPGNRNLAAVELGEDRMPRLAHPGREQRFPKPARGKTCAIEMFRRRQTLNERSNFRRGGAERCETGFVIQHLHFNPCARQMKWKNLYWGTPSQGYRKSRPQSDFHSYVERQNLTLRMTNRRFTRLTNAFSKKIENHKHMMAIYAMNYNFCRIHQTLRVTPAMEAGIANHVWSFGGNRRSVALIFEYG